MAEIRYKSLLRHLAVWFALAAIPVLLSFHDDVRPARPPYHGFMLLAQLALLFYLNFFILVPRLYLAKRILLFFTANILLTLLLQIGVPPASARPKWVEPPPHEPSLAHNRREPNPIGFWIGTIILSTFSAGAALTIRLSQKMNEERQRWLVLETEHLRGELSYLKLQVSPHFLFNTLNNIYSLVGFAPERAQTAIHHLSKLLRYLLYETTSDLVPLNGEVAFLHSYMELMALRLPTHMNVDKRFEVEDGLVSVAPLLLLPLVENAFKHGVHPTNAGTITIELEEAAGVVDLSVSNPDNPRQASDQSGSGLGLANLTKRLALLYPNRHRYTVERKDGLYMARLTLRTR